MRQSLKLVLVERFPVVDVVVLSQQPVSEAWLEGSHVGDVQVDVFWFEIVARGVEELNVPQER